jgi:hypothetical protein
MVDRERESLCSYLATLLIPLPRLDQLLIRFGMELDGSHPRRKSFALTSFQGIVATAPDSISRHLRSASSAHSSSTSGSGGGSRLSISKPANVARSLSGSSKTSRKTSLRSRDIGQFYSAGFRFSNDYSSRVEVRRMSRTGGPHHFLTCPHIQHEHILRLSALCLAQPAASCARTPNSFATRRARAITRWRWLRRSARRLRRCAIVSRSSCVITFHSTSAPTAHKLRGQGRNLLGLDDPLAESLNEGVTLQSPARASKSRKLIATAHTLSSRRQLDAAALAARFTDARPEILQSSAKPNGVVETWRSKAAMP